MALLQRQDLHGIDEFERAYTIARELESYDGAMIEHNYGVCLLALGDLAGARDVQADAHRRAGRLGLAYTTRLVDGARACLLYHSGEWQEARTIAARVISEAAGSAKRGDAVEAHTVCGRMDIARGDAALASLHARKAVALAREIGEPQYFISALGFQAQLHVLEGRVDMASRLIRELLAEWWIGVAISAEALTCAALAASALPEVREAFAAAASAFRLPSRWVGAAHALATGEFALAASAYADMSSLPDEAYARSRLGRQLIDEGRQAEGAAELERSILFWKRVGATEYAQSAACWIERAAAT
jgi:hypothetical protein